MSTRRRFLGSAGIAIALAGCLDETDDGDGGDDDSDPDTGDTDDGDGLDEIDEYDPVDMTGESEVEIDVSASREPHFDPSPVMVETMTTIRWSWNDSDGELYPVDIPDTCQWSGADGGTSHSWEFPFTGKYEIGYEAPESEEVTGIMFVVDD